MVITKHKFSSQQYHLMAEAGVFSHDQKIELIKGEIIQMSPIEKKHAGCVAQLQELMYQNLGFEVIIWTQNSIQLADGSEPQPDLALLKRRKDFYRESLPTANDILLIIEVADSTISYDRDLKIPLYSEFGIVETWLVDLNQKILTKYTNPSARGYKTTQSLDLYDAVSILGSEISVKDIFGS